MELPFKIPIQINDLLKPCHDQFYVRNTYTIDEIPDKLQEIRSALSRKDDFIVFKTFESFYAVLDNSVRIPAINLFRTFDLLYKILSDLIENLQEPLNAKDFQDDLREKYLKAVKMLMFLFCGLLKVMDKRFPGSGDNKKSNKDTEDSLNHSKWEEKRERALLLIYNIIQLPLEILWNPPIAEENFTLLFCDVCYQTLENHIKQRHIADTVFQILGTSVKRYNHAMILPTKLLQTLRNCEHSIPFIVSGVIILIKDFNITSILKVLIDEIIEELEIDEADSQTSKNFGNFLNELTVTDSELMYTHLANLSSALLFSRSYNLRINILKMIGDVIVNCLTSEELSDEDKSNRDDFFESLYCHMHDSNAYCRAKVLQIFIQLQELRTIPLAYQSRILSRTVERLSDKSGMVRKSALILIKSFLETNPYAAKLTYQELTEKCEMELKKLNEIQNTLVEFQKNSDVLLEKFQEYNEELITYLIKFRVREHSPEEFFEIVGDSTDLDEKVKTLLMKRELDTAVRLVVMIDERAGNDEKIKELTPELYIRYYMTHLQNYYIGESSCKELTNSYVAQEKIVDFFKDSIDFSKIIGDSVPKLEELLRSKTNSDVIEVINVFTTGYLFGIKGIESGMINILNLIWSTDKEKRDAVTNAYNRILFVTDKEGKAHALKVVINLSNFFDHLTQGYYKAFVILMKEWIDCGDIDNLIIQVMFERFTLKLEHTTEDEARKALELLVIASNAKPSIALANIEIFEKIGLKERGLADDKVYNATLKLLSSLYATDITSGLHDRLESTHGLVQTIVNSYKTLFFMRKIRNFDPITANTFNFIYSMTQTPDIVAEEILYDIMKQLEEESNKNEIDDEKLLTQITSQPGNYLKLPVFLLERIINAVGFVAMKEMIILDVDVYKNIKYRQEMHEKKQQKQTKRQTMNINNMSASNALKRLSGSVAEQNEEEMNAGASADDRIAETINHLCEKVLLESKNGIFEKFTHIVIEICKYPNRFDDRNLYQAAVLCLIRFMSVSSEFCESNIQLLMNILNDIKNDVVKQNILIGMTDFMFRFPNVIGIWSDRFFSMLHDSNDEVRLTSVKMLSYLIMQEMIKVKGHISDLVLCIEDDNEVIRTTTQQFFREIATKPNTLYNILPDVIARLGISSVLLSEDKYQSVMRFIFGLVDKNRQVEGLVDKLCFRFKITTEERQWRDAVFCLGLLTHTDKTIRKLIEHIPLFKDKVQIDEVYNGFKYIIKTTSSKIAPNQPKDIKDLLNEFETKLNECLEVVDRNTESANDEENQPTSNEPMNIQSQAPIVSTVKSTQARQARTVGRGRSKTQNATKSKTKTQTRRNKVESEDDESNESLSSTEPPPKVKATPARSARRRLAVHENESDSSFQESRRSFRRSGRK